MVTLQYLNQVNSSSRITSFVWQIKMISGFDFIQITAFLWKTLDTIISCLLHFSCCSFKKPSVWLFLCFNDKLLLWRLCKYKKSFQFWKFSHFFGFDIKLVHSSVICCWFILSHEQKPMNKHLEKASNKCIKMNS